MRQKRWLLVCCYNAYKSFSKGFLTGISQEIHSLSSRFENFLIIGDFKCEIHEDNFCQNYDIKNLTNNCTCNKNHENPKFIDLIKTNKPKCFQNPIAIENGLSDFHKITTPVLKTDFERKNLKLIVYRKYKNFDDPFLGKNFYLNSKICYKMTRV